MEEEQDLLLTYNIPEDKYYFSPNMNKVFSPNLGKREIHDVIEHEIFLSNGDMESFVKKFRQASSSKVHWADFQNFTLKTFDLQTKVFCIAFICAEPGKTVLVSCKDLSEEYDLIHHLEHKSEYDELTGLMNSNTFSNKINEIFQGNPTHLAGKYAIIYFDVIRFKAINDLFGKAGGDLLLIFIAEILKDLIEDDEMACRVGSDRYALFVKTDNKNLSKFSENLIEQIGEYQLSMKVSCNVGIYVIDDTSLLAANMLDRAVLAESTIKGTYAHQYRFYTEDLRQQMLTEQEVVGRMVQALYDHEFVPYFQPQFNHSTGELVGAEALVRWEHPEKGLIRPDVFIPIFENNGFITPLDLYIFECACKFIKQHLNDGLKIVPISTNFSRYDIMQTDFVDRLEEIRTKYDVPVKYLRVEITESAVFGENECINHVVHNLHDHGYIVEMDDFGSGYSSLNVLKDIDFDIIKLDMKFLSDKKAHSRGGTVISSIVSMARWLNLPIIAEGVESVEQADFLKSIGADYIQGYLYSKPIPELQFIDLLKKSNINSTSLKKSSINEQINTVDFWNPKSLETLIYNTYVGAACIISYFNNKLELQRVNQPYIEQLGVDLTERELLQMKFDEFESIEDLNNYKSMIKKAIETKKVQECKTWRVYFRGTPREKRVCILTVVRLLEQNNNHYILYGLIRNVTEEMLQIQDFRTYIRRSVKVCEQVGLYFWEYDVKTKRVYPGPRIMKEFNLPSVLENYPECMIGKKVIEDSFLDTYIQWHKDIANGQKHFSAIVHSPLDGRELLVRYETEFDENGKPIRAIGSAIEK